MVANLTSPLRALLFVVLLGEPLLVIWAVLGWGADSESRRRIGRFWVALVLVQPPVDLWQVVTMGNEVGIHPRRIQLERSNRPRPLAPLLLVGHRQARSGGR